MTKTRVVGPVKIVGSGLIGTSIGLALSELGVRVLLVDSSPAVLKLAVDFGAGEKFEEGVEPSMVVVCVPPDVAASVIVSELASHPGAAVTDVSSVKATILSELEALGFLCLKVLELYYEDMDNLIFDDDEFLLYVDDWFIQAMNLEFGKSKYTSKDSSMVWVSDLSNNKKLNGYTFKIEVNYDKTTKSVKELSVGGFTKKTKKFIGHSSTLFLGEDIDDLINKIYDLGIDIVEEYKS